MKRRFRRTLGVIIAGSLLAVLTSSSAFADVSRNGGYAMTYTITYTSTGATNPGSIYTHVDTLNVSCAGSFTGAGTGTGGAVETITGSFSPDGTFSMTALNTAVNAGDYLVLSGSGTEGSPLSGTATLYSPSGDVIDTYTFAGTESGTSTGFCGNHGQYVSSQGGGPTAAHSDVGMPVQTP